MGHAVLDEVVAGQRELAKVPVRFESLVITEPTSLAGRRSATLAASIVLHSMMVLAIIVLPLLYYDVLPTPGEQILRTFFVAPPEMAPPPPPPPPPAPAARITAKPVAPPKPVEAASFVAPIEIPSEIKPEESLDLGLGIEGGVPGGVEGGVPGGVVGGVVGGLPQEPPARVVRVGGQIVAPKLVRSVKPVYPPLALQARASAVIIMEAQVDTRGYVKTVSVLRGHPLFDQAAVEAVRQWRYKPLLLNGEPTEFILTVTVIFNIAQAQQGGQTN